MATEEQELKLTVSIDDQASAALMQLRQTLANIAAGPAEGLRQFNQQAAETARVLRTLDTDGRRVATRAGFFAGVAAGVGDELGRMGLEMLRRATDLDAFARATVQLGQAARAMGTDAAQLSNNVKVLREVGMSTEEATRGLHNFNMVIGEMQRLGSRGRLELITEFGESTEQMVAFSNALDRAKPHERLNMVARFIREEQARITRTMGAEAGAYQAQRLASFFGVSLQQVRRDFEQAAQWQLALRAERERHAIRFRELNERSQIAVERALQSSSALGVMLLTPSMERLAHLADMMATGAEKIEEFFQLNPMIRVLLDRLRTGAGVFGIPFGGMPGGGFGGGPAPAPGAGGGVPDIPQGVPFMRERPSPNGMPFGFNIPEGSSRSSLWESAAPPSTNVEDRRREHERIQSIDSKKDSTEQMRIVSRNLSGLIPFGEWLGVIATQLGGLAPGLGRGVGRGGPAAAPAGGAGVPFAGGAMPFAGGGGFGGGGATGTAPGGGAPPPSVQSQTTPTPTNLVPSQAGAWNALTPYEYTDESHRSWYGNFDFESGLIPGVDIDPADIDTPSDVNAKYGEKALKPGSKSWHRYIDAQIERAAKSGKGYLELDNADYAYKRNPQAVRDAYMKAAEAGVQILLKNPTAEQIAEFGGMKTKDGRYVIGGAIFEKGAMGAEDFAKARAAAGRPDLQGAFVRFGAPPSAAERAAVQATPGTSLQYSPRGEYQGGTQILERGQGAGPPAAATTPLAAGQSPLITANMTGRRTTEGGLEDYLEYAARTSGVQVDVAHGIERGHARHREGAPAYDLDLRDPQTGRKLDMRDPKDQAKIAAFVENSVAAGATGIGAGSGQDYMGPHRIHVGGGTEAIWGAKGAGANAPQWLKDAFARGKARQMTAEQRTRELARLRQTQPQAPATPPPSPSDPEPPAARPAWPRTLPSQGAEMDKDSDVNVITKGKVDVEVEGGKGVSVKAEGKGLMEDTSVDRKVENEKEEIDL